jgi:4-hydroxy-2-oxoheptanedioate aldolase
MRPFDIRRKSSLRTTLDSGEPAIGCFIRVPAPEIVEAAAYSGFDFAVIDTEHTLVNPAVCADLVRAAEAAGITPLIRSMSSSPEELGRLLESGAIGLHVPQVHSAEGASAIVEAVKYAPEGTRGLATGRATGFGLRMPLADYVAAANRETLVVVQVESVAAIDSIEEIAAVPGIDILFVGLTDLSLDAGFPGQYDHPEMERSLDRVQRAAEAAGLAVGVPVASPEMARNALKRGIGYIVANDVRLLTSGMTAFLSDCQK